MTPPTIEPELATARPLKVDGEAAVVVDAPFPEPEPDPDPDPEPEPEPPEPVLIAVPTAVWLTTPVELV